MGEVRGIFRVGAKSDNPKKTIRAKASDQNMPDGEGRKLGERTRLDTWVVLAVNDVDWVLQELRAPAVPKGNR